MFLRWLHKSWKYFWTIILSIILFLLVVVGGAIGLMQMQVTKNYLADWLEQDFANVYEAELSIGRLDGFLPFTLQLDDVTVSGQNDIDSTRTDTLANIRTISANVDVFSLFQNTVSITGFSMSHPQINLYATSRQTYSLPEILRNKAVSDEKISEEGTWVGNIEILAPQVSIQNGRVYVDTLLGETRQLDLPEPLTIRNMDAQMFLEISSAQRLWDIESLTGEVDGIQASNLAVSGQIYNDGDLLEFNAFNFVAGNSEVRLNGDVRGVDLFQEKLSAQLRNASYDVALSSEHIVLQEFKDLYAEVPDISEPVKFELITEGRLDSLRLNTFSVGIGESFFQINGLFQNLLDWRQLTYDLEIYDLTFLKEDLELFTGALDENKYRVVENLSLRGQAAGTVDSLTLNLEAESLYGELDLQGDLEISDLYHYSGSLNGTNVNIAPFFAGIMDTTNLNFEASLTGRGTNISDANMELTAHLFDSFVDSMTIDRLDLESSLASGFWEQDYTYQSGRQSVEGTGWMDFRGEDPSLSVRGHAEHIDLAFYPLSDEIPSSDLNFDYNIELKGLVADRIQGRANIDIKQSVIARDTVRSHQLYMDLDSPDLDTRSFRLTSSIMDLNVTGNIKPSNLAALSRHWRSYLTSRIKEEVLLDSIDVASPSVADNVDPIVLDGDFRARDLALMRHYWPSLPDIESDARFTFNVNADSSRLLLSSDVRTDSTRYGSWRMNNSMAQLTASFQSGRTLKEFSNVDFESTVGHLDTGILDMDSVAVDIAYSQDSLSYSQQIASISDNASMNMAMNTILSDTSVSVLIDSFFVGNNRYAWQNVDTPKITYNRKDELTFETFSFRNEDEYFELQGSLSPDQNDSLAYMLRDVNLSRVSELINGKVDFAGTLNGSLQTRSLMERPSIQGNLKINRFTLNNRLIGDITFNSAFNQQRDRFDTQVSILTDSTKYTDYLETNDNTGQNIVMDGYFVPPDLKAQQDTVFNFDIDFNEIDLWVLPLITENVFQSMEGQASGNGYLTGNFEDFDYAADFQTENVFARPRFLNTNYFLSGPVSLNRDQGVVLDSVRVTDTKGGTGLLWGTVDLNDFNPITYLDLTFQLNNLQFLNNEYDPDVPFYGNVSGTGELKLTGANNDLFLRTSEDISVSNDSRISVPLLEETELSESTGFIEFVESFNTEKREGLDSDDPEQNLSSQQLEQTLESLTFSERFDLDLQFQASDNVNVELIFDRVTGEVLTAQGAGQVRISMQDEEVQMFGRYDITGGEYNFVSGEIITRRLTLEDGGSIVWEGDPANASLNIEAVYNARPNIQSLNYRGNLSTGTGEDNIQRVPVDLIIEINGTVTSVENDYYFRLANSLDLSSNSTLSFAINQINRNEQQKLMQATSILLSGEFIPTESGAEATTSLSQNLTRSSTVINPILSNQVISPLLSNQINSLLNSDVSRFDIDFNLNAYNEIDLGIALRLYNDRLILRREGQITGGSESSLEDRIGDLNATYRINRGLSVTAFHRQDQTLNNVSTSSQTGDVTPSVDGLGLEAQVQFNTWQDLKHRIASTFRKIFGIKEDQNEEDLASGISAEEKDN